MTRRAGPAALLALAALAPLAFSPTADILSDMVVAAAYVLMALGLNVYGAIVVIVMLLRPEGLVPARSGP